MGLEFYNNRKREKFMKIVILDGYAANPGDLDYHLLEKLGEVVVYPRTSDAEKVERAKDADIILLNKVQIDAETLAQLPKLKYIGIQATGFNVVDIEAVRKQNWRMPIRCCTCRMKFCSLPTRKMWRPLLPSSEEKFRWSGNGRTRT